MKTKNTYSLLIASEEKGRSIFEAGIYALVLLCTAFSGWQFASNSVALPRMAVTNETPVALVAKASVPQPAVVADHS